MFVLWLAIVTRTKNRSLNVRVTPAIYARLTEIASAYREAGVTMSVNRLAELYVTAAMLKDGYSTGDPVGVACAPEVVAAFTHNLEACPHDELVSRIRTRRGGLMRDVAKHTRVVTRDPETVAAEVTEIEAEIKTEA